MRFTSLSEVFPVECETISVLVLLEMALRRLFKQDYRALPLSTVLSSRRWTG